MNRIIITVSLLLIIGVVVLLIWQGNVTQPSPAISDQKSTDTNTLSQTEKSLGNSFIEQLRAKDFIGGEINIEESLKITDEYSSYLISYPSDDLTIFGVMNVPNEDDQFPVVILNHGYFNASTFISGDGTRTIADILATNGYITLASDYRGHGRSENDSSNSRGHNPNYSIDVLNLIASVKSLQSVDVNRIGMWGHSMGGEVSMRVAEATDELKAIVLWAPTSTNSADNAAFYGGRSGRQSSPNTDFSGTSPINFLNFISTPISLHQGLADTEVNPEWSNELNDALKREGKQVEYFEYIGQDHNFKNLGWDEISKNTLEFLDKYLKN